jgi:two-component system, NtrC family, C4-dicarboxylate transport sensor histidine kinase DctB
LEKKINAIKDLIIVLFISLVSWFLMSEFDVFELIENYLKSHEKYELDEVLFLLILWGILSIFYSIRRVREAKRINKLLQNTKDTLETKIISEVRKRKEKEYALMHESKHQAVSEATANIANHWREPLDKLVFIIENMKSSYKENKLDELIIENSLNDAEQLTTEMSKTIDKFRNFFKSNKEKQKFLLDEVFDKSLLLLKSSFLDNKIDVKIKGDISNIALYGYPNEFSQALMNILNNAREALQKTDISNKKIVITSSIENQECKIDIFNNGKKIKEEYLDKIFDPYFTIKEFDSFDSGIGLYMTKTMIEKNMNGKIEVKNITNGVVFTIKVPIKNEFTVLKSTEN